MFSFYPSHSRPLYYSPPIYSVYPDDDLYSAYHHPRPLATDPAVRYRRALGEYLAAAEGYNTLLRARREAKLRAHVEALRRERASKLARARKEQVARQFEQGLAKALARAAVSEGDDLSLHHVPVVRYRAPERPLSDMACPPARASCTDGACVEMEKAHYDAEEETSVNQPRVLDSESYEHSVPNLESLLRERLQKIAGDEEVQDLARAILRHLTSLTGVSCPSAAASSPEVNTSSTQPAEGALLSRSHALKGVAAEAAKASFKAHRAEVADKEEPSPTSPTSSTAPSSLSVIRDIRSALAKLSAGFSLPPSLDFSDGEPDGLAYTPTNAPVRAYEHALDELLAQLDAVETDGDEEVRGLRRAAVKEVEKAIEDVERRVREARESAKPGSNPEMAVSAEVDSSDGKDVLGAVDAKPFVDSDRPGADEPSPSPSDRLDPRPSSPEVVSLPNPEVELPHVTNPTVTDDDDQSSTPGLGSVPPVVPMATASLAPTDQLEVSVSTDDGYESMPEGFVEQGTTDQSTSMPLEPAPSITPPESPLEVSRPVLGAIAPSSTPVPPVFASIIPEDLPASLSRDRLSVSLREDDIGLDDGDDESEWTEI